MRVNFIGCRKKLFFHLDMDLEEPCKWRAHPIPSSRRRNIRTTEFPKISENFRKLVGFANFLLAPSKLQMHLKREKRIPPRQFFVCALVSL